MEFFEKDYYAILGITPAADEKAIKQAFRELARQHHPDVNPGKSEERFKQINEAYQVLSDPERRKEYDDLHFMYLYMTRVQAKGQSNPPPRREQDFVWRDSETSPVSPPTPPPTSRPTPTPTTAPAHRERSL